MGGNCVKLRSACQKTMMQPASDLQGAKTVSSREATHDVCCIAMLEVHLDARGILCGRVCDWSISPPCSRGARDLTRS